MKKTLIIDAHNLCWRLAKKLPMLTAKGEPVQVVYGFLRALRASISQFEPNFVLACWDEGHSEIRKKFFEAYKANRDHKSDPEHAKEYRMVIGQMEAVKELLRYLNVAQMSHQGVEADDLIGLSCARLPGTKVVVSSDMDMLQLVEENVQVWSPIKLELFTFGNFRKKTGLSPAQYLELRALVGDKSDNIPGVAKGFGETTAKELLLQYGSLDNLFTSTVEKRVSKKGNRYALLYSEGAREAAYRNLFLMDLRTAALEIVKHDKGNKILSSLDEVSKNRKKVDKAQVQRYFTEKAFRSLLSEFGKWITPFESLDWGKQ